MSKQISFKQRIILIISGLLFSVVLLEAGLRLSGYTILYLRERRNMFSFKQSASYCIMTLGESTTVCGGENSWPRQLEKIMNRKKIGINFKVVNKAIEGMDSNIILDEFKNNLDKYKPNMVITMMGINDGWNYVSYQSPIESDDHGSDASTDNVYSGDYFEGRPVVNTSLFVGGFRVPKLVKIIWLSLINKLEENKSKEKDTPEKDFRKEEIIFHKYKGRGQLGIAQKIMRRAAEKYPDNEEANIELGDTCVLKGDFKEAEESLKKAIAINPKSVRAFTTLGWCYTREGKFYEAEESFKMAIKLDPNDFRAYDRILSCYKQSGKIKPEQLEFLKKKIEGLNNANDFLFGLLGTSFNEMGLNEEAEEFFAKADEFRLQYYIPKTRHNYNRLKGIITQRGIRLVCVQYPMRGLESLKKLFFSKDGVIFVDNKQVFKTALKKARYKDYFTDSFGGDFGHCTRKGNRLLAENIAKAVTKEVFNK